MNVTVIPGALHGRVTVPPSKSAAHRLLIAAALSDAPTRVHIGALNRDIEATLDCLRALGAGIEQAPGLLAVRPIAGGGSQVLLDCGESGSTLRFMLPVAAALGARARIVGHGRLPLRPNAPLTDALREHGAVIDA
ncbi:MAG: 3-phosphoshikimate 1-carboxyvinyltransferase, partial [Clostridia bacterium]|nr:3-phosphoshikimate 1-carboxyvinyltransferase [Clostridia bacterium]